MLLSDVLAAWLRQQEANGRASHTLKQLERHGRKLVAALNDPLVDHVKHEQIAAFLASDAVKQTATGTPRRPSSGNALRSSVRGLFAFARDAGYAKVNAARLVRRVRVPLARPRAVPEADVERLVRALDGATTRVARRDRAMILVLARSGVRVGSLVALDVEDLDGDQLTIRRLKGGGEDSVFLPTDALAALREHLGDRTTGPMFAGPNERRIGTRHVGRRLAEIATKAGIAGVVSPHRLRHSVGVRLYSRTGDVLLTARALCHRSVASTQVYARVADAQLRAAIAG
ncbi:MAG: tyrosine-type recombinase/integrase [Rhodoglobus sp.]